MRELFAPHYSRMALGLFILFCTNLLALSLPRLVKEGVDAVEGREVTSSLLSLVGVQPRGVLPIVVAMVGVAVLGGLFRTASRVVLFNIGRDVEHDVRRDLFAHLSTLSPSFYAEHPTGDVMSRMTNDLNNLRLIAGFALLNTMNAVMIFGGNLPLMFASDWRVTLFALLPFPIVMGAAKLMAKAMYARTKANQERLGALTSYVQENLAGQQVVRAFSQSDAERERFAKVNEETFQAAVKLATIRAVMFPVMGFMMQLGLAITLIAAGYAVLADRMTVGDVVEFNARLLQLAWPAIAFGFIVSVFARGRASLDRINMIFAAR